MNQLAGFPRSAATGVADPFWALFDALPIGAVVFDPGSDTFVAYNEAACRQLGYSRDAFARLRVGDVDLLRSLPELLAARQALVAGAPAQRFRTRQRAADGGAREVEVTMQCIVIDERRFGYAVWQDVTLQESTLAALRDREAELARVQRIGKVGGFEVDLAGGFRKHRSDEYRRLHGLPADAALETHEAWLGRLHPEDRERADRTFRDAVAGGAREYASEYRVLDADGECRWIAALAEIERDAQGRALRMVGAHIDVTALKRAETALADQASRLQLQDQRKNEFLAMLGHELRNPMAAMLSVSEILRRSQTSLPGDVVGAHRVFERHLAQLRVIVDDLLDVARIHTGRIVLRRDRVDMAEVVRAALEQTAALTGRLGHRCDAAGLDAPSWVSGDAARLTQVVSNLLCNAAKYTGPGGTIAIALQARPDAVELTIRDDGIGIPADLMPHIFDLFVQSQRPLDRTTGGLGIGLTLAKAIVLQHGGEIAARSDGAGAGSTFTVRLPRDAGATPAVVAAAVTPAVTLAPDAVAVAAPDPGPDAAAEAPAFRQRRVVVVDDNVDVAQSMAALLELDGHAVTTLHDGAALLETIRRDRPHAVLLDLGLPGRDGYSLAREIRQQPDLVHVVLVALTGYGQEEDRRRTREAGFDAHFVKPVGFERIAELIATLPWH